MWDILVAGFDRFSVQGQARRTSLVWLLWFLASLGLAGFLGLAMLYLGPKPAWIGWLVFFCGAVAILFRPRYGVYLVLFLGLVGDGLLTSWYPFTKNFSSAESIFYLHNSLIISPLEVYLGLTFVSWLGRAVVRRQYKFYTGPLFWPVMVFVVFICFGLVYGLGTGGNANIGLWESRPIFYLPLMLVLVSNLITTRQHLSHLMWFIMVSLFIEGISGNIYFFNVLHGDLESVDTITEHSAAIHMNTLFVFAMAAWLYKASPAKRFILPAMIPVVLLTYLATQRRAAFVSLIIAMAFIALILFIENRRVFWLIVPPLMVGFALYTLAFWNSASPLGLPAQAVKSVVSQTEASQEDLLSNLYRYIENINSNFTIHVAPLTGVGFGKKFYIIASMPDISMFEWWEYITHNSIIWIWMKTGIGGFISVIYMIGLVVLLGGLAVWRMPGGDMSAIALTAVLYIVMHFVYAYVDMSWDIQSMVYVGAMMGVINVIEHIVTQPTPLPAKRWPWQPDAKPMPTLKPVPSLMSSKR
jgi:hypothetical protein